jgi:glycosyltransferase involved in cell wall biosynthesis
MSAATLDVAAFAPEEVLAETRGRDLRLFRRFHRLAGPVVLYAGAYDRGGGLAEAVAAACRLSERIPELRLVAVPFGPIRRRYLDRCEREALRLGHRGIVERRLEERDVPLWFAVADVVCVPGERVDPLVLRLAAAAATPVVEGQPGGREALDAALLALLPEQPAAADAAAVADTDACAH